MSHTPGPWNFHHSYYPLDGKPTETTEFEALSISIAKGETLLGEVVAFKPIDGHSTGYPRIDDYEELKANARLIIAAPDLLEALEECEEYFDDRQDADYIDGRVVPNAAMTLLGVVRAAIAKAEGRSL